MSTRPTYSRHLLFQPGSNGDLNACVGKNGGPYDFSAYGMGFFQAALHTIEAIKNRTGTSDLLVYPVVFDFRHGIELYLKHLTILANRLLGSGAAMQQGHGIMRNWDELKALFTRISDPAFDPLEIAGVQVLLDDIVAIDATGQVFRYPEDNKGAPHLEDIVFINVAVLEVGMRMLLDLFETWDSHLTDLLSEKKLSVTSI